MSEENRDIDNEKIDQIGRLLVRKAAMSEQEVEKAISSPFLYNRVLANIRSKKRDRSAQGWIPMLLVAWRLIPVMMIITVMVFGLFWKSDKSRTPVIDNGARPQLYPYLNTRAAACSLSNKEGCSISDNDVLVTIFSQEDREAQNELRNKNLD